MNKFFRIIDANLNRVCEGLRVCEDYLRFNNENIKLSKEFKELRHNIRNFLSKLDYLENRDSLNDVGLIISKNYKLDDRKNINDILVANLTRAQEGIRVIEETLKLIGKYDLSKEAEHYRFVTYKLEKDLFFPLKNKLDFIKNYGIYGITAHKYSNGKDNIEVVKAMLDGGIKVIQYREKEKSNYEKFKETLEIKKIIDKYNALFIIDDDIDIALTCDADGVHLGQEDIPLKNARDILGNDKIIGISTHEKKQALKALEDGADYIGVGPIYKTFTKDNVCPPVGLSYLDYVSCNIDLPFVSIGGIKEDNILEVLEHGGRCISLVTGIVSSDDIYKTVKNLYKIIDEFKKSKESLK